MAVSNKKFILFYSIIFCVFSLSSFSSELVSGGIYDLVEFLEDYEELDFYDKNEFYEFETTLHAFNENSKKRIPIKIQRKDFEAELVQSLDKDVQKSAKPLMRAIVSLCEKHQVDPYWVTAMIWTESHFKVSAKSEVGASGLMQVMPTTFSFLKDTMDKKGIELEVNKEDYKLQELTAGFWEENISEFKSILENLEVGIFYIKLLNKKFENAKHATVAYNMGPTWVSRNLNQNKEVASERNQYLNKVKKHYKKIVSGKKYSTKTLAMVN